MGLPAHTVSRRGRAFAVSAGGQLVGMWTDASAAEGGVYLWRPGSEWSREMIAAAAQAAAVAGIADGVAGHRRRSAGGHQAPRGGSETGSGRRGRTDGPSLGEPLDSRFDPDNHDC
jgi:hypothetical protein